MKFKIDENLPIEIVDLLTDAGYDAESVYSENLAGEPDTLIAAICQEEGRVIVTLDLDFSNILHYPPSMYAGIILLRLKTQDKPSAIELFKRVIPLLKTQILNKKLWIVDKKKVRIRD